LGKLTDARESYQQALRLNSNNTIARKNVERSKTCSRAPLPRRSAHPPLVDLRLFITETGKTALTTVADLARGRWSMWW